MRSGLRVVTKIGAMTNVVVTRKIGKVCEMGSQVTFPNILRNKLEPVERGEL